MSFARHYGYILTEMGFNQTYLRCIHEEDGRQSSCLVPLGHAELLLIATESPGKSGPPERTKREAKAASAAAWINNTGQHRGQSVKQR